MKADPADRGATNLGGRAGFEAQALGAFAPQPAGVFADQDATSPARSLEIEGPGGRATHHGFEASFLGTSTTGGGRVRTVGRSYE